MGDWMSFEKALKENKPKKTPVSWEPLIENILDQYYENVDDLSHSVQKDAIQNSWDARVDPDHWKIEFKLLKDSKGKEMLIIEDHGTTGLTGKIWPEDKYDEDLPEGERWGRFQGLAFRREKKDALGARGQGKFVFVGASKTRIIVYDTLREDGVYRIGTRKLGDLWEYEDAEAINWLKIYSPDLKPLSKVGTRIMIDEPEDWLKYAIQNGLFMRYIQTTWWYLLLENKITISVTVYGKEYKTIFPEDVKLPTADSEDYKVWIKDWLPIGGKTRKGLCIKKLQIVWSKKPVEKDLRGIAVLRGGMVVERIPAAELLPASDPELPEHIYGYAEGDLGVEFLLKKIEDPTHYKFTKKGGWGKKNVFGAVKECISTQFQLFANQKLGSAEGTTETKDYSLIKKFNQLLNSLDVPLLDPSVKVSPPPPPPPPPPLKDIDLIFPAPDFRHPLRRVEFGQEIRVLQVRIKNRTTANAQLRLRIYTEQEGIRRDDLVDKIFPSALANSTIVDGPFSVKIDKATYTNGRCYLRAILVCLDHPNYPKGTELDKTAHLFWIAQDPPPGKGTYRDIQRLPEVTEEIEGKTVRVDGKVGPHPEGGNILYVNTNHPIWKRRAKSKDDEEKYIFELMAEKLPQILIANDLEPFKGIDEPNEIVKRSWALYSQIMEKYYT